MENSAHNRTHPRQKIIPDLSRLPSFLPLLVVFFVVLTSACGLAGYDESAVAQIEQTSLLRPGKGESELRTATLLTKLVGADETIDQKAQAMALGDETVAMGVLGPGAVYVFSHRLDGSWGQDAKLTVSDTTGLPTEGQLFGSRLAMNKAGTLLAVRGAQCGWPSTVFIFERTGSSWRFKTELIQPSPIAHDSSFGTGALAMNGDLLAVSAPLGLGAKLNEAGTILVYKRSGSTWTLQQNLQASDAMPRDGFGSALAMDANTLVAGAPNASSAYVFTLGADGKFAEKQQLRPSDRIPLTQPSFGSSVALDGASLLVGSPRQRKTYSFSRSGGLFTQDPIVDGYWEDLFGGTVALSGNDAAIFAGGVWNLTWNLYHRTVGSGWSLQASLSSPPAWLEQPPGGLIGTTLFSQSRDERGLDVYTISGAP